MKVFYWSLPLASTPRTLYQADSEQGYATSVPIHAVGPDMFKGMLEDGFTEISADTAYSMGLPS